MIKGTITKNGLTVDLECSNPSEFIDVVKGTFSRMEKETVSASSPITTRTRKYQHHPWTDRDITMIAEMVVGRKDNLNGVGVAVSKALKASGDCRVRNVGTVWSKVAELKDYLLDGGTTKIPTKTIRQLSNMGVFPITQRASSSFKGSVSRRMEVAHEA